MFLCVRARARVCVRSFVDKRAPVSVDIQGREYGGPGVQRASPSTYYVQYAYAYTHTGDAEEADLNICICMRGQ